MHPNFRTLETLVLRAGPSSGPEREHWFTVALPVGRGYLMEALDPDPKGLWWTDLFELLDAESDSESFSGSWVIEIGLLSDGNGYTGDEYFLVYPSEHRPPVAMLSPLADGSGRFVGYYRMGHGFSKNCPTCGKRH